MRIGIIGLGLMGASFAKAWNKNHTIIAYDQNKQVMERAVRDHVVTTAADSVDDVIHQSDLLWICLYPVATKELIETYQSSFPSGMIVCDIAGIKSLYNSIPLRDDIRYLWTHPIAGRAASGYDAHNTTMFQGANFILTPTRYADEDAISKVTALVNECGFASITEMTSEEHDARIAYTSQLTHAIAVSLMNSGEEGLAFAPIIGDSYRDLTRIARINDAMWSELFLLNQTALLEQMQQFKSQFTMLLDAVERGDQEMVRQLMRKSKEKRERLS
jgi:prephenate dehydrogenase